MTDVFVSYARSDRDRVVALVKLLEAQGWSVWWDRDLIPGSAYEAVIDDAISRARCVVVVWSRTSVDSEWVQAEAGDGLDRHILVPVLFDDVRVPISFRRKHAARLLGWPGERDPHEIEHLLRAIAACVSGATTTPTPGATTPALPSPGLRPRRRLAIAISFVAAVIVIALAYLATRIASPVDQDTPALQDPALAVLPLEAAPEYPVEAQVSYELAEALRRYPTLRVLSDEAIDAGTGNADYPALGRRLAVDFVITGRVLADKRAPRLQISLVSTLNGGTLWEESFRTGPEDLPRIAATVSRAVQQTLRLEAPAQGEAGGDVSSEAYLAYLRGRAALRQPNTSASARQSAIRSFERAVAADSRFALGYAGLCRAHLAEFGQTHDTEAFESAEKNCHRALTLEDQSSPVSVALGALYEASGQYDRALGYYERALDLTPYDADALRGVGNANAKMGLVAQAERAYRTVIRIEPTYWENYRLLGGLYFMVGRYDQAAEQYRKEADLNPSKASSLLNLGSAHYMAGDLDAAIDDWSQSLELDADAGALSNLGAAQFFKRNFAEAGRLYERALAMKPNSHAFAGNAGEAYFFAGDDRYAEFYEQAIELADRQLAINPDDAEVLSSKACYYAALGDAESADAAINRAIELNGRDVYTWYDAARVFVRLNRRDEAADAVE